MEWAIFFNASLGSFLICVGVLGLIVGSFLNVVILRLPKMLHRQWTTQCYEFMHDKLTSLPTPEPLPPLTLLTPRSHCPHCQHQIKFWQNIPVFSFIFLRGKCIACHHPISWRYPLIEIVTMLSSVICAYYFGFSWQTAAALILTWTLITLSAIDYDHQLLPDDITLPALWLGLIFNLRSLFTHINDAVLGTIIGYLFLWSLYWLFKIITHKEGMGYGDFKLLAMLGAWLGWQALPGIVLFSSVVGAIIGIMLILLKRHQRTAALPFGPFIALGGWIMLIWGNKINTLYLNFAGYL
ncbi:MAG: prepilin peptidase [Proteobacteria bacterium]|nr:prepilin peptidase [Pseudomonadota bacterium]